MLWQDDGRPHFQFNWLNATYEYENERALGIHFINASYSK